MRAVLCKDYGLPSYLVIEDVASVRPGAGEVLVSVRAAAVNFPDVLMIQNNISTARLCRSRPAMRGKVKACGHRAIPS